MRLLAASRSDTSRAAALDLDQTARRHRRDTAEAPIADDVLLLDNVVARGTEERGLDTEHRAVVEWRGVIRVDRGRLRHVQPDAVAKSTEPDAAGRQVQRRTDCAAKRARRGNR